MKWHKIPQVTPIMRVNGALEFTMVFRLKVSRFGSQSMGKKHLFKRAEGFFTLKSAMREVSQY